MSSEGPFEVKCCHGVVSVKPGDKLVIAGDFDTEDIEQCSKVIAEHLPGVKIVCIGGVSQMVVMPGEGAAL